MANVKDIVTIITLHGIELVASVEECDFILAIGGDGTILRASKVALTHDKSLIGYNTGTLGFLSCHRDIDTICRRMLSTDFFISSRKLLNITHGVSVDTREQTKQFALNEIVVSNSIRHKLVDIVVTVMDTNETMEYQADAIIFATPTGSTAYNLAAGGTLVHPSINCILITPVAPFSMSARPLILPDNVTLSITSVNDICVMVDGSSQVTDIPSNELPIHLNEYSNPYIKLVQFNDGFLDSIKTKLGWGQVLKHQQL